MSYARHRPVNCAAGRKYHRWREVPMWLRMVPIDHALRLCDHCGANGRVSRQGVVELVNAAAAEPTRLLKALK